MSATERYQFDLTGDLVRAAQELDAAFAGAWAPRLKGHVKATRTYAYFGGPCLQPDGTIDWIVDGTVVCPDDALCLVQRDAITGVVTAPTPAVLAQGNRPMAVVRCTSGLLERFVDARDSVLGAGAQYLDELLDLSLYDLQDLDTLVYDLATGLWINVPGGTSGPAGGDLQGTYPNPTLRDGAATSVIGRSANSSGAVADIAAVADNTFLRRVGGVLAFGALSPGGGVVEFPDSPPASPTAYDEEGDQAALDAKWTAVSTPGGTFTTETDRDGTFMVMSGPGAASNNAWVIRQAIGNTEGDYNAALTVTCKVSLTSSEGTPNIGIGLSNNAALSTGDFVNAALVGGTGIARTFSTNNDGSVASTTLPGGGMTLYIHYQRNTAATNNVRVYISFDGRGWNRLLTATKITDVDYLFVFFQGGVASQPTANFLDWLRVNDPRFLQPE